MLRIEDLGEICLELKINPNKDFEKIDIANLLTVDKDEINDELSNQSALYAYFAVLASQADADLEKAKFSRDVLESDLYAEYRIKLEADGIKVTEKMMEMKLTSDERMKKTILNVIDCNRKASILTKLERALAQRKDMVFSIALNSRTEFNSLKQEVVKSFSPKQ